MDGPNACRTPTPPRRTTQRETLVGRSAAAKGFDASPPSRRHAVVVTIQRYLCDIVSLLYSILSTCLVTIHCGERAMALMEGLFSCSGTSDSKSKQAPSIEASDIPHIPGLHKAGGDVNTCGSSIRSRHSSFAGGAFQRCFNNLLVHEVTCGRRTIRRMRRKIRCFFL